MTTSISINGIDHLILDVRPDNTIHLCCGRDLTPDEFHRCLVDLPCERITKLSFDTTHLLHRGWITAILKLPLLTSIYIYEIGGPTNPVEAYDLGWRCLVEQLPRLWHLQELKLYGPWVKKIPVIGWSCLHKTIPLCIRLHEVFTNYYSFSKDAMAIAKRSQSMVVQQLLVLLTPLTHPRTRPGKFLLVEHIRALLPYLE